MKHKNMLVRSDSLNALSSSQYSIEEEKQQWKKSTEQIAQKNYHVRKLTDHILKPTEERLQEVYTDESYARYHHRIECSDLYFPNQLKNLLTPNLDDRGPNSF